MILFAEIGCSALILLGLFTRLATLPLMFGMIVAAFFAHSGAPFSEMEQAISYLLMFLVLLLLGPGKYSIDALAQNFLSKKNK